MNTKVRFVTVLAGVIGCAFMASTFDARQDNVLEIKDDSGRVRMRIGRLRDDEYGTVLFDASGVVRGRVSFSDTVNATSYEIRDDHGREVAMMYGTVDGLATIRVGSEDVPRAQLLVSVAGTSSVGVFDGQGRPAATMYVTEVGDSTSLILANASDVEASSIAAMQVSKGRSAVVVRDASAKSAAMLEQVEGSHSELDVLVDGQKRVVVGSRKDISAINLRDSKGTTRVSLEVGPMGAGIGALDSDGSLRASLGVNPDAKPSLKIRDKNGNVMAEVPPTRQDK